MEPAFVLVHSLLLGPLTWGPVAARLTASGAAAVVPSLVHVTDADDPPFWPRVAAAVNDAVSYLPQGQPVVLVAHSNAGLTVPVVVRAARRPVAGCLFVDASLPSRAGPTPAASPERLTYLRTMVTDGRLPQWTTWWDEDDVAPLFPDPQTRSTVSAEQPRLPLSYYEQQIPVPAGWDHRPCGYLLFGPPYDRMAQQARERGWDVNELPGGHLHQLVDPEAVTARIVAMSARWGFPTD
ncbi:alpha/beta hydrolase [Actinomycetes bacterium KLBMP 9797]